VDLFLTRQAEKDLFRLSKNEKRKATVKLEQLGKDPLIGKKLTGKLKNFRSLRSWPYRIIYHIEEKRREVWVDHIIHRQGVYK
jgi:mRNA-degrading endonuclease RelE of RelBE toxin-antitoxin system